MPRAVLASLPELRSNVFTERASQYLTLAHQSAGRALAAMHELRDARRQASGRSPSGRTSDQDQDLLRAMLVFSCAGLDAAMKALIEDSLPTLADRHDQVQRRLEEFGSRRVAEGGSLDARVIGRLLAHPVSPRAALVQDFVDDLTGGSLQSVEQLHRVRSALGIDDSSAVAVAINDLRQTFKARNEVSHEMDLTPLIEHRSRRHRGIRAMVDMANSVLAVGCQIVNQVAETTEQVQTRAGS